MNKHIMTIRDRFNKEGFGLVTLDSLFGLNDNEVEAIAQACEDKSNRLADIGHDINGLASRDEFFVPRLQVIADTQ